MKWTKGAALLLPILTASCGPFYRLPGHHEGNRLSPPPVVLKTGQKMPMVTEGFESLFFEMALFHSIHTDDPSVARVSRKNSGTSLWIEGVRPGKTRAYYAGKSAANKGFEVTVVDPDS